MATLVERVRALQGGLPMNAQALAARRADVASGAAMTADNLAERLTKVGRRRPGLTIAPSILTTVPPVSLFRTEFPNSNLVLRTLAALTSGGLLHLPVTNGPFPQLHESPHAWLQAVQAGDNADLEACLMAAVGHAAICSLLCRHASFTAVSF